MKLFPLQEAFVRGTERAQRALQGLLSSVERQCTCQLFFACPITLAIYFSRARRSPASVVNSLEWLAYRTSLKNAPALSPPSRFHSHGNFQMLPPLLPARFPSPPSQAALKHPSPVPLLDPGLLPRPTWRSQPPPATIVDQGSQSASARESAKKRRRPRHVAGDVDRSL